MWKNNKKDVGKMLSGEHLLLIFLNSSHYKHYYPHSIRKQKEKYPLLLTKTVLYTYPQC